MYIAYNYYSILSFNIDIYSILHALQTSYSVKRCVRLTLIKGYLLVGQQYMFSGSSINLNGHIGQNRLIRPFI